MNALSVTALALAACFLFRSIAAADAVMLRFLTAWDRRYSTGLSGRDRRNCESSP